MGRNNQENMDIRRIRRLLSETTRIAERASMTGSLQGGGKIAIRQYNAIRNHLQDIGAIPDELFQELDEDEATFDELGVMTGMLDRYLEDEEEGPAEEDGEHDDRKRRRMGRRGGPWGNPEVWRFWSDPQALHELQEMGEIMREHLPELLHLRDKLRGGAPAAPPSPPAPPAPPTPPAPPEPAHWPHPPQQAFHQDPLHAAAGEENERRQRARETAERIQAISGELQREDLDYRERIALAKQLGELSREQAQAGDWQ
jgi:hypothetical protein